MTLALESSLRHHRRVSCQGVFLDLAEQNRLFAGIPALVPFRKPYVGTLAVLDWDHKLPSQELFLRVYAYCEADTLLSGHEAYDQREADIGRKDRFPEFDVPDFEGIVADEAYEFRLAMDGALRESSLKSSWRRFVDGVTVEVAVRTVRASPEFARLARLPSTRPALMADLEVVCWMAPCESELPHWTVDVWHITRFDGRVGMGLGFLVDPETQSVARVRDITVQSD